MEEIKTDQNASLAPTKEEQKQVSIESKVNQQDNSLINVECLEPKQQNGHTVYTVKGQDNKGTFEVIRRFNDFFTFRQVLVNKWPGNYIPPIPPKKAVGNMDQAFIEERRCELEFFLKQLGRLNHLWYSEETQMFIRQDVEKMPLLSKVDYAQLIKKYEEQFVNLVGKEAGAEVQQKIVGFASYLKTANLFIENFKNLVTQHMQVQNSNHDQMIQFIDFIIPSYEETSMKVYLNNDFENKLFVTPNNKDEISDAKKLIEQLRSFSGKNEYITLLNMLKFEIRELDSFQETLDIKAQYEANLKKQEQKLIELNQSLEKAMQGKSSITTTITGKQNSQVISELEKESATCNETIKQLTIICEKISLILAYIEIDRFKEQKQESYYQVQKKLSSYEFEYEKAKSSFWDYVLNKKGIDN